MNRKLPIALTHPVFIPQDTQIRVGPVLEGVED